jgi:predicted nucleotidyltransferase
MWLDIVPFAGLEREGDREIEWPGGAFRMNVAAFDEALAAAVEVELADDVVVLVASLPGLAKLKILAWRDRHTAHARDATDRRFLMSTYADAGNYDRLYNGDALDLLQAHGFETERR